MTYDKTYARHLTAAWYYKIFMMSQGSTHL